MFYDYFAELCKTKGVSMSEACRNIGISKTAPMKWKSKDTMPSVDILKNMVKYFDIPLVDLAYFNEKEKITEDFGDLSNSEIDLIKSWRLTPEETRKAISTLAKLK